jgi:hypothetical protein
MTNLELFPRPDVPDSTRSVRPLPSPASITRKHLRMLRAMSLIVVEVSRCLAEQLDDLDRRRRKRNKRQRQLRRIKAPLKVGRPSNGTGTKNT